MASAASKLKQLTDSFDAVLKQTDKTKKSWKDITDNFSKIVDIQGKLHAIEVARERGESTRGMGERALKTQLELLTKNNQFIGAGIRLREHEAFAILPDLIAELGLVAKLQEQYNDALIQANSGFLARLSLLGQIAIVQVHTGASSQVMSESIAAAVKYGHDLGNEFGNALEIITMMKVGLGVSANTTSEMLAVTKSIGGNWQEVVDGIARVKTETALAAEQAAIYASQIGRAQALLGGKNPGKAVGPVGEYLSGLEGAAQEIGMQQGEIIKMVTGFTKSEGLLGVSTLGYDPSFLKDLNKTKGVVQSFANVVNTQLGASTGFDRANRLKLLAEQFNTTTEVVGRVSEVIAEYNKQLKSDTTLQRAWAEQTHTVTSAWNRLKTSLVSILQGALVPMVFVAGRVLGVVADVVEAITKFKGVVYALGVAINLFILKQAAGWIMAIRAAGTASAVSAATGIAAEAGGAASKGGLAIRGWQTVMRFLPGLGRLATAVFSLPVLLGAVFGAVLGFGVNRLVNAWYDAADKANIRNQPHYVQAASLGQGLSYVQWVLNTQKYLREHKNLTKQQQLDYLSSTASQVRIVQQAILEGKDGRKMMEGLAAQYKDLAAAQIYREALSRDITVNRDSDMKQNQEQLDTASDIANNTALTAQFLEQLAKNIKDQRNEETLKTATQNSKIQFMENEYMLTHGYQRPQWVP